MRSYIVIPILINDFFFKRFLKVQDAFVVLEVLLLFVEVIDFFHAAAAAKCIF